VADYPYPPDEFDAYDQRPTPVGVHRAPRSWWSRLWPFLLVIALCATVAVVGIRILLRSNNDVAEPGEGTNITQPAENGEEPGEQQQPEETAEPEPEGPEAGSLEALLAAANMDASIRVLNDTGPSGEAARGTAALQGHGFSTVEPANYPGDSGLAASSVWYSGEEYRDTALAVAKILGVPEDRVTEHSLPQGNINVIVRAALAIE